MGRGLDGPGLRGAVVVLDEALDRGFAGDVADGAAADAVGERDDDALAAKLAVFRHEGVVEILVDFLWALVGVLPDGDFQFAGHGSVMNRKAPPKRGCDYAVKTADQPL